MILRMWIILIAICVTTNSCSPESQEGNSKADKPSTPTDATTLKSSLIGEWVGNNGMKVNITKEGELSINNGQSLFSWEITNSGKMLLTNLKEEEPRRLKRNGIASHILIKDTFQIEYTDYSLDLTYGMGRSFLTLLRYHKRSQRITLADLQGEWNSTNSDAEVITFSGDTISTYQMNYEYQKEQISLENGYLHYSGSSDASWYDRTHSKPLLFWRDTLLLGLHRKLVRRTKPLIIKPHIITLKNPVPKLSVHELMYCDDIIDRLFVKFDLIIEIKNSAYETVFIDKKDFAMIDSLIKTDKAQEAFKGYTLTRLNTNLIAVKDKPLLSSKNLHAVEIEYCFFRTKPTGLLHISYDTTIAMQCKSKLETTHSVAILSEGKFITTVPREGRNWSTRKSRFSLTNDGTLSIPYPGKDIESLEMLVEKTRLWL